MSTLMVWPALAWRPGCGQERHPPHSAAQTPNPGPWSTEKTSVTYQLFIPFVVQRHSNIFTQKKLLNRNRKQKYPINLTEFLLRCGQSSQNMKLFLILGLMRVIQTLSSRDSCRFQYNCCTVICPYH